VMRLDTYLIHLHIGHVVSGRGVGSNSIRCTGCRKWVHKKCSGIKGSMSKVMKSFICRGCLNPVTGTGSTSEDIDIILCNCKSAANVLC